MAEIGNSEEDVDALDDSEYHLAVLDDDRKLSIISEWQTELCTENVKTVVCASCSKRVYNSEAKWVSGKEIDWNILRNKHIPERLLPRSYNTDAYQKAILNPKGLHDTHRLGKVRLCDKCHISLSSGNLPKFALANWLYYAHDSLPTDVRDCFARSSMFERMLICRARFNSITCRFDTQLTDNVEDEEETNRRALDRERRKIRGNIIVTPLDVFHMNNIIPPPSTSLCDTMCAIFVGNRLPTRSTLKNFRPILVRKSRVKKMIMFLLENNTQYKPSDDFAFSESNLNNLFDGKEDEALPSSVHIGYIPINDAIDGATSDYTRRNIDPSTLCTQVEDDLLMDNVGYTEGDDSPKSYRAMKHAAMERCLQGKPFLLSGKGTKYIPDFYNPSILTWLFLHLDPWGIGGFFHPGRHIKIGMEEQLKHLLMINESPFEQDPEFPFVFYNVCRKALVSQSLRFVVSRRQQKDIVNNLLKVDVEVLQKITDEYSKNTLYVPTDDKEKAILRLLSSLQMISRHVPGSDGYKLTRRNEIRSLIVYRNTPTLFVTINPSDVDNPIVRVLAGEDICLEDISRGEDMSDWNRKIFAARNPSACARFFDLIISKFIKIILRHDRDTQGLYGKCTAYYGTVEAQGKGTLHCHMLIWLQGHLSPQALREKMKCSESYREKVFNWLESIIKSEFPGASTIESQARDFPRRILHKKSNDPHPGVIPNPMIKDFGINITGFWREYNHTIVRLLHEYSWHEHQATCWKYLSRHDKKSDKNCRMGMNGQLTETTALDPETHAIILRRHHPSIANYTPLLIFLIKCNMDVKFVGTGEAAKAFIYYVTDYITKPSLSVHVGMAALSYAIKRTYERLPEDSRTNLTDNQNISAVTTAVNSMMGRQEISKQQVMSYLVGSGDHYKSDEFCGLQWGTIQSFVIQAWNQQDQGGDHEHNDTVTLTMGVKSISASSQQLDYIYRSDQPSFTDLCLYDFVSLTNKVKYRKAVQVDTETRAGSFINNEHPQFHTHYLSLRDKGHIPVLLGPKIPNRGKSDVLDEEWSRDIMILFKPWRSPLDLKDQAISWRSAYELWSPTLTGFHQRIISNIQVLADCNEAKDKYHRLPRRKNQEMTEVTDENDQPKHEISIADNMEVTVNHIPLPQSIDPFSQLESEEITEPLDFGDIISDQVYSMLDMCLPLTMEDIVESTTVENHRQPSKLTSNTENTAITHHRSVMIEKKKRKRVTVDEDNEGDRDAVRQSGLDESPIAMRATINDLKDGSDYVLNSQRLSASRVAEEIIIEMNLESNSEQLKAFTLVARHVIDRSENQLLLHIAGVGGTGKSHVIRAIVMLFERLGRRKELLIGAPTGIAAVLINGQTLHSLILTSPNNRSNNNKALCAIWKPVTVLISDEMSMVGARFLSQLSSRMKQGKGDDVRNREKPFGGVSVIFTGDFGQLNPPKQHSLYSHQLVKNPSFSESRHEQGISAMNGAFLWRQVKHVVELIKNQRHAEDPAYAAFLDRLRVGECTAKCIPPLNISDLDYIKDRLMENLAHNPTAMTAFRDAPIVVGSKALRDILNAKLVRYHARRQHSELAIYYSTDCVRKKTIKDRTIQKHLWDLSSSVNNDALGRLPLFIGMKVMITENIAFDHGVVNGTEGVIYDIKYEEDEMERRYAKVVYVYIAGSGVQFNNLPKDVVPIFPVSTRIDHSPLISTPIQSKTFYRNQVPLIPAYVFTDFKSQGRTMKTLIADLATARGQGVYVMLLRVKSLSGLLILRWFPPTKILHRLPQELRDELTRLHNLSMLPTPSQ